MNTLSLVLQVLTDFASKFQSKISQKNLRGANFPSCRKITWKQSVEEQGDIQDNRGPVLQHLWHFYTKIGRKEGQSHHTWRRKPTTVRENRCGEPLQLQRIRCVTLQARHPKNNLWVGFERKADIYFFISLKTRTKYLLPYLKRFPRRASLKLK